MINHVRAISLTVPLPSTITPAPRRCGTASMFVMSKLAVLVLLALCPTALSINPPGGLSLHGLKKVISHFWDGKKHLLCADCIQLAMQIDQELYKPHEVASDDVNIAASGLGRRMGLAHKEPEVAAALETACDKLAESNKLHPDVLADCKRLMGEHRKALEDSIFAKGTSALAETMCVARFNLCNAHTLMDSGEL